MKTKTAVLAGVAGVAVVAVLALAYASPYLALNRAKRAADARDAATLNQYVDFPALRASLKQQLADKLTRSLAPQAAHNPLAMLGEMVGRAVVSPLVDAYATPDGVAAILNGVPPGSQAPAAPSTPVPPAADGSAAPAPPSTAPAIAPSTTSPTTPPQPPDTTAGYRSLNQFVVTYRHGIGDATYQAIFQRRGLFSWQLTAVDLDAGQHAE